jgi:hypothetical protein
MGVSGGRSGEMDEFDPMGRGRRPAILSASDEFRPPEPDPPEPVVIDLRLPGPDDQDTD